MSLFLGQVSALYLGILAASIIFNTPTGYFWVPDSLTAHLPASIDWSNFITNEKIALSSWTKIHSLLMKTPGGGGVTHFVTGLFILIFGITPCSSMATLLLFNLLTIVATYKICSHLFDETTSKTAIQLYGLCPTVFFYHIAFYKESVVQFFVAFIIALTLIIFHSKRFHYIPLLVVAFYLLRIERFYISYLLIPTAALNTLYLIPKEKKKKVILIIIGLMAAGGGWYFADIKELWNQFSDLMAQERYRYSSYSDVLNKYNYDIPYPLAFIKILFSPYFSLNKFSLFREHGPSLLWIWGSFLNQAIILGAVVGGVIKIRENRIHITLWISFFLFLALAAYVSPWSGRLRDSYYPLLVCYCAWLISRELEKRHAFKKVQNMSPNN